MLRQRIARSPDTARGCGRRSGWGRGGRIIPGGVGVREGRLTGLDPMARAESLALFQELGRQGMHVVISSHILDEVDRVADRVVLITGGGFILPGNNNR